MRRVSHQAVRCLLPFIYMRPISGGRSLPHLGSIFECNGRRILAHLSVPFCAHGKCRGACLKPSVCRSLQCNFQCDRGICTNVAKRGSTNRPFNTLRGGRNCSCCSCCLLVAGVKQLGALTLNGCQLDFNRKLMIGASFLVKGDVCLSSLAFQGKNVQGRSSASRCGCFQKMTATMRLDGRLMLSTFCSRHDVSKIVRRNRVASVCGANLRHDRGRTSGGGIFAVRLANKGVACAGGRLGLKLANVCCFFSRSFRPRLQRCSGCGVRNGEFCGMKLSCKCH